MPNLNLILFDAAGTLIATAESVGDTYCRIASSFGISSDPVALQHSFSDRFRRQPPMICNPALTPTELTLCERIWWKRLVAEVFGDEARHPRFDSFFEAVFEHYRSAQAWTVYPEVTTTLAELRRRGFRLSVVSNFDSRLFDILAGLGLSDYFASINLSTHIGAAKPNPAIFESVLNRHKTSPDLALHVGDSFSEDVQGALAAGLRAVFLDRINTDSQNEAPERITRLDQILDLIPKEYLPCSLPE
ncbi:MAG: HAD-IA family hydrolase [Acidobacteria bacterium]|nr:HAD-IA family hydrolase [Acidobacteriota bacterium]